MNKPRIPGLLVSAALAAVIAAPVAQAVTPLTGAGTTPEIILVAGAVEIDAPGTVDPGVAVTVTVSGANPGGRVEIWGPVTQSSRGGLLGSASEAGAPVSLTAPGEAGSYELRYLNAAGALRARKTLDVAAVPITLSVPRSLGAGTDSVIEWRGPGAAGDMLQVYDPAAGAVLSEAPATGAPGALNTTTLRGPERLGEVHIRYWSGGHRAVLRSLTVDVTKGEAWFRTPIEVFAGETFTAEWVGPSSPEYAYQIVDPATDAVMTSQAAADGIPARLKAPAKPGDYRIRYVNAETGFIVADLPLDVDRN